jgi:hypothetical protein
MPNKPDLCNVVSPSVMKYQYLDVFRFWIEKSGFLAYRHDDIFLKSSKDFIK